jgi:hypothetical protein
MRRSIDDDVVPEPPVDEAAPEVCWSVGISDDYDDADPRVQVVVEERGAAGHGLVLHLSADRARRLRLALASALRELGEDVGR